MKRTNKELIKYIRENTEKGYSKNKLTKILLNNKWSKKDIESAFKNIEQKTVIKSPRKVIPQRTIVYSLFIVVLIASILAFTYFNPQPQLSPREYTDQIEYEYAYQEQTEGPIKLEVITTTEEEITLEYDALGNLMSDSGGYSYQYDHENRLTRADMPNTLWEEYVYDYQGNRIKKIKSDDAGIISEITYIYDSSGTLVQEVETIQNGCEFTFNYQEGWNLISLPLEPFTNSLEYMFPDHIKSTLYSYNSESGYQSEDSLTIDPGKGYWLRFSQEDTTTIKGNCIEDELTISLNQGWNLIGGISTTVHVFNIDDPNNIIIPGTVYEYAPEGFLNAETIEPGKSYWIRASTIGEITLS